VRQTELILHGQKRGATCHTQGGKCGTQMKRERNEEGKQWMKNRARIMGRLTLCTPWAIWLHPGLC